MGRILLALFLIAAVFAYPMAAVVVGAVVVGLLVLAYVLDRRDLAGLTPERRASELAARARPKSPEERERAKAARDAREAAKQFPKCTVCGARAWTQTGVPTLGNFGTPKTPFTCGNCGARTRMTKTGAKRWEYSGR